MTRRHLRNIERTDARRVRPITFNLVANFDAWKIARFAPIPNLDRRDYVWPDAVETPTSGTETGLDGDEGAGSVSVEGGRDFDCCAARDRDIAEAVAHEREAIARWLTEASRAEQRLGLGQREQVWIQHEQRAGLMRWQADQIRAGAHNEGGDS